MVEPPRPGTRIGEVLAEARRQAGLTAAQVSQRTRIRETIIRGIEEDDFSACGGDFYARGHIRAVAKVVGADPEPLIQEYDAAYRATGPLAAVSLDELTSQRPARAHARRPRPRWTAAVLGLAALAALGFAGYRVLGSGDAAKAPSVAGRQAPSHGGAGQGNASPAPASSPSPTARGTARQPAAHHTRAATRWLAPVKAAACGPSGTSQGDNPGLASLAVDRSAATAWRTDWYTTARFGNLYRGTGLLLDMGRAVTITAVQIDLGNAAGANFQVRAGLVPSLARLRPVARAAGAAGMETLRLARPAPGRYLLVWFTKLPTNSSGAFQADVRNVRVEVARR